jgi:hypothetical protein
MIFLNQALGTSKAQFKTYSGMKINQINHVFNGLRGSDPKNKYGPLE